MPQLAPPMPPWCLLYRHHHHPHCHHDQHPHPHHDHHPHCHHCHHHHFCHLLTSSDIGNNLGPTLMHLIQFWWIHVDNLEQMWHWIPRRWWWLWLLWRTPRIYVVLHFIENHCFLRVRSLTLCNLQTLKNMTESKSRGSFIYLSIIWHIKVHE